MRRDEAEQGRSSAQFYRLDNNCLLVHGLFIWSFWGYTKRPHLFAAMATHKYSRGVAPLVRREGEVGLSWECHESAIASCPSPSRQMTAVCHLNTFLDMRRIMATFVGEFVTVMQPREMSIRKSRVKWLRERLLLSYIVSASERIHLLKT